MTKSASLSPTAEATPGPWRQDHEKIVGRDGDTIAVINDPADTRSAPIDWPIVDRGYTDNDAMAEANARLIAAAPEMRQMIETLYAALSEESSFYQSTTAIEARALLARIDGKEG